MGAKPRIGMQPIVVRIKRNWVTRRRVIAVGALVLCAAGVAATSRIVLDVLRWRDMVPEARAVGIDVKVSTSKRVDAVVVLHRETRACIETLLAMAEEDGEVGQHAKLALSKIAKQSSR